MSSPPPPSVSVTAPTLAAVITAMVTPSTTNGQDTSKDTSEMPPTPKIPTLCFKRKATYNPTDIIEVSSGEEDAAILGSRRLSSTLRPLLVMRERRIAGERADTLKTTDRPPLSMSSSAATGHISMLPSAKAATLPIPPLTPAAPGPRSSSPGPTCASAPARMAPLPPAHPLSAMEVASSPPASTGGDDALAGPRAPPEHIIHPDNPSVAGGYCAPEQHSAVATAGGALRPLIGRGRYRHTAPGLEGPPYPGPIMSPYMPYPAPPYGYPYAMPLVHYPPVYPVYHAPVPPSYYAHGSAYAHTGGHAGLPSEYLTGPAFESAGGAHRDDYHPGACLPFHPGGVRIPGWLPVPARPSPRDLSSGVHSTPQGALPNLESNTLRDEHGETESAVAPAAAVSKTD
ncbi:hypothetical protein C8Q77DRAFT_796148 [Trametes polyzona]|nr:hypothetical protein C8Q77DRAFT_796148 [Trametes polyzona]